VQRYEYGTAIADPLEFSEAYPRYYIYQATMDAPEIALINCDITRKSSEPVNRYQYYDNVICYQLVTEYRSQNSLQGKTEYHYAQPAGLEVQYDITNAGFPLTKQIVFSYNSGTSQFDTLQATFYDYKIIKNDSVGFYDASPNPLEKRTYGININMVHDEFSFEGNGFTEPYCYPKTFGHSKFRLISAPLVLLKQTQKVYSGSQVLTTITENNYGSGFDHLEPVKMTTYKSDGRTEDYYIYYPDNLPSLTSYSLSSNEVSAYDTLKARNMMLPVIIENKIGSTTLSKKLTSYKLHNALVLPYRELLYKNGQTLSNETILQAYDPQGNITEAFSEQKGTTAYIWDYASNYLSAQAINAAVTDVAHTSFESDGKGNWSFSGALVTDASSPTGGKCYYLPNGNITRSGMTSGKAYIVSYWSKNGSYTITGAGSARQGRTANGWTYYEYDVTGVTSTTVSGSGYIDELRLYPKESEMTSYTYQPLVGVTSVCDARNSISYYVYDGMGRLILIRDLDGNIIKKLNYKYAAGSGE
jgi:YD repeat-containing protein